MERRKQTRIPKLHKEKNIQSFLLIFSMCYVVYVCGCRAHWASCYSRRIFRHSALEEGQVFAVLVVQPLHFKVQVHVICTLAQAIFFVF